MSDQYVPDSPSRIPSAVDTYRQYPVGSAPPELSRRANGDGFASGILVAAVFIVVAILAAILFNPRNDITPAINQSPVIVVESDGGVVPKTPETTGTADTTMAPDIPSGTKAGAGDPSTAPLPDDGSDTEAQPVQPPTQP